MPEPSIRIVFDCGDVAIKSMFASRWNAPLWSTVECRTTASGFARLVSATFFLSPASAFLRKWWMLRTGPTWPSKSFQLPSALSARNERISAPLVALRSGLVLVTNSA